MLIKFLTALILIMYSTFNMFGKYILLGHAEYNLTILRPISLCKILKI